MPTERWLNVWCIWHTKVETLQEFRSRRRIGWIIQDFRETCVSRSLTFRLETKMPWRQTPSRKKKAVVFSKVCEIFKVHGIESLKYVREFYTLTLSVIVATCHDITRWMKQTVIGCLTCRSNGLMGGPWPMKATIHSRPSAVSLKVWLHKTSESVRFQPHYRYLPIWLIHWDHWVSEPSATSEFETNLYVFFSV